MSERWVDILIYIGPREDDGSYPVHAELDDGSHFRGGKLLLDMDSLLAHSLEPQAYGMDLFYALFNGPVRRAYDKITGRAEVETGGKVRVRMWIDQDAAELHALPWERLYHTHRGQDVPLATSALTPFSRYTALEIAQAKAITKPPLHILFAVSNPKNLPEGLSPVDVSREVSNLRTALGDLLLDNRVQVMIMPGYTGLSSNQQSDLERQGYQVATGVTSLNNIIRELGDFHVLHFTGHGRFIRRNASGPGSGVLFLENESGDVEMARDEEIVSKLAGIDPQPHLVFLAACESATRESGEENAFVGLGPKLVAAGIPAVVAMQDVVPMDVAGQLVEDFYHNLIHHGRIDLAMNQARLLLTKKEGIDWAIPVLFMRLEDGSLVDFSQTKPDKPLLPYEPETVVVPAGPFLMGSNPEQATAQSEGPQHQVHFPAYRIGAHLITNSQYQAFLEYNPQYEIPRKTGWFLRQPPPDKLDHPIVGVTWQDALAYCHWLSQQSGRVYRLPTEAEWEKAARGTQGNRYPWGENWDEKACNTNGKDTSPVGAYPLGMSPFGCYDMMGNVQEWTSTIWGASKKECDFPYPYQSQDGREDLQAEQRMPRVYRVHRGGSFEDPQDRLTCAARDCALSESATKGRGFRVVLEIPAEGET
jgi:formylglycine-generating enzyme required for sulfatase activity